MAIQHQGYSGVIAEVDADRQAAVVLNSDMSKAGYAVLATRNDEGAFTDNTYNKNPETDADFRLRTAGETVEFTESWAGAALNSAQWSSTVTTMTTAVAGGYLSLNSGSNAAVNTVARVTSYRTLAIRQPFPLAIDIPIQVAAASVGIPNTTWEIGLFFATGVAAPTDGVFLRMNASGALRLVSRFNGSETESADIDYNATPTGWSSALLPVNTDRHVVIVMTAHDVELWIDNVLVAELDQPPGVPTFSQAQSLPISFRIYNAAVVPSSATILKIGPITASTVGMDNAPTFAQIAALSGHGGYQGQSGGTMGQTATFTNSADPSAASLSNTSASYATLGGLWTFAAPAGAATDFALFGYQVPAAAAGSHNKNLLITGVRIDSVNVGAAVATTATVLAWGIAVGCTAASLATAEAATTKSPRRLALGMQAWVVGAAIGTQGTPISMDFSAAPLLAEPGTYVHIIVRVPVGTATASQVIRGTVTIASHHA